MTAPPDIRDTYGPGRFLTHKRDWLASRFPATWRDVERLAWLLYLEDEGGRRDLATRGTWPIFTLAAGPVRVGTGGEVVFQTLPG